MRARKRWLSWVVGIGLLVVVLMGCLVGGVIYRLSPQGVAKAALGVWFLPGSARDLDVSGDGWTDCTALGYMEVSPEDLERLLKVRKYESSDFPPRGLFENESMRIRKPVRVTTSYSWEDKSSCVLLETDGSRSWVYFEYTTGLMRD